VALLRLGAAAAVIFLFLFLFLVLVMVMVSGCVQRAVGLPGGVGVFNDGDFKGGDAREQGSALRVPHLRQGEGGGVRR